MLMSIQLHDCPLWPSVVLTEIDQGRDGRALSGTSLWWIYQLLVQACSVFSDNGGDSLLPHEEIFMLAHLKTQGQANQSTLAHSLYLETIKIHNGDGRLIFSPSLKIITQHLHFSKLPLTTCTWIIASKRTDFIVSFTQCPKLTWKQSKSNSNFPVMAWEV